MEVSDPRARLATLSSAWSPCHVWSTFARRWDCLVVGVCASKICTANVFLHLSSGFALLGFPRSCTRLLWIVVFPSSSESSDLVLSTDTIVPKLFPLCLALVWLCPLRTPGRAPAEALFESAYDPRSRSCPRYVWLCASWSVGTSRRRRVRID